MTKEEIIKNAYGNYDFLQDKNGWCLYDHLPEDTDLNLFDLKNKIEDGVPITLARPKSLQGIETNNGWIKIESEDDLPEDKDNSYFVKTIYSKEILERDYPIFTKSMSIEEERKWWLKNITHYQPIVKPKPPIY